jgi:drug/metabolite transporter (DMT)-like permease
MTYTQIGALILLGMFTVVSSLVLFNIEKNFNTPTINHVLLKALSLVALFAVGVFIFNESYTTSHLLGIGVTITGIVILIANPVKT